MNVDITDLKTVRLSQDGSAVIILDQTCLPGSEVYVSLSSAEEIWEAIYRLKVRGAPAIGIALPMAFMFVADRLRQTLMVVFAVSFSESRIIWHLLALLRSTWLRLWTGWKKLWSPIL